MNERLSLTFSISCLVFVLVFLSSAANADRVGSPRAIIEEINAPGANLSFMDYVHEGRVIDLKEKGMLSLSYLLSCTQETIIGGRVIVGRRHSIVRGGVLERRNPSCPGSALSVTKSQGKASGVIAFRRMPIKRGSNRRLEVTLRHVSPIIEVGDAKKIRLQKLDPPKSEIELKISLKNIQRGKFVDFAKLGIALIPGAKYRVTVDKNEIEFSIHSLATARKSSIIERLIFLIGK